MDNEEKDSVSGSEEKVKKTGTLNLEDVSINTLKDDLAKKDSQAKEGKGGVDGKDSWFSFLAKHQSGKDSSATATVSATPAQDSSAEKTESEAKKEEKIEPAPPPIEDEKKIIEENRKDLAEIAEQGIEELQIEEDLKEPVKTEISVEDRIEIKKENSEEESILEKQLEAFKSIGAPKNLPVSEPVEEKPTPAVPPLSSFITPKIEPETQNKLSEMLSGKNPEEDTGGAENSASAAETPASDPLAAENAPEKTEENKADAKTEEASDSLPKIDLEEESPEKAKDPIKFMSSQSTADSQPSEGGEEEGGDKPKNPFTARLGARPGGDNSLLQSVESALNYSAAPEYAEEREKMEEQIAKATKEVSPGGKTAPVKSGFDKKWLLIGGGSLAGVVVLIIIIVVAFSGSSKQPANANLNQNTAVANKNENSGPIKPLNSNVKKPVVTLLKAEKVIPNVEEVKINDKMEINSYLSKMRTGGTVSKMTQIIFIDSNGSAASLKDLMDNTEISVPEKIVADPAKTAAILIADFFAGKTILGLAIKSQSDTITTLEKMQSWESTMTIDLSELWKGIVIDNPNAYFANSGVFKNGRFALIDKKSGLSLDYLVENGYILITCGRDSMAILKGKFTPPEGSATAETGSKTATEEETPSPSNVKTPSATTETPTETATNKNSNASAPKAQLTVPAN